MNALALIRGLKNGDAAAYSLMVDTYHKILCVYAFKLTHDRDLAKDIVQNVFINVWRIRLKLEDDFAIKSYLYKSVYNEFLNQKRNRKDNVQLDEKYLNALNNIVEEDDDKSLEKLMVLVKREIENLPPKCKETFLLSKREGLSNIEIAIYLNVSIKSVEAHLTKAFTKLRKKILGKMEGVLFLFFELDKRNEEHPN